MGCISMTACRRLIACAASPLCSSVRARGCHSTSCVRGVSTCFINHSSWMICWIFLLNCYLNLSLSQWRRKLVMDHWLSACFLDGALLLLLSPQKNHYCLLASSPIDILSPGMILSNRYIPFNVELVCFQIAA